MSYWCWLWVAVVVFFRKVPSTNFSPFQPKIIYRISNVTDALWRMCGSTVWRSQRVKLGQRDGPSDDKGRCWKPTCILLYTWFELSWILDLIIVKHYMYKYNNSTLWYVMYNITSSHCKCWTFHWKLCTSYHIHLHFRPSTHVEQGWSSRKHSWGREIKAGRMERMESNYPVISCQIQTQHEFQKWYIIDCLILETS